MPSQEIEPANDRFRVQHKKPLLVGVVFSFVWYGISSPTRRIVLPESVIVWTANAIAGALYIDANQVLVKLGAPF